MFCKKCGTEIPENEIRCSKCGASVETEPAAQRAEVVETPRGFSNKRNILIIVIAAVLALGIGGTAIGVNVYNSPGSRVSRYLGAAERYLSEMNYEQAVIEFKNILKIEPMNVDAYMGLADAYIGMGDTEKALEVLREGLEKTGDTSLQAKIDELTKPAESSSSSSSVQTSSSTTSDTTSEPVEQSDDKPKATREYDEENRLVWEDATSPDGTVTTTNYGEYYDEEGNVTGWGVMDKTVDRLDENGDTIHVSWYSYDYDGTLLEEEQYNDRGDIISYNGISRDLDGDEEIIETVTHTYKYEYGPFGAVSRVETRFYTRGRETDTSVYTTNYTYDADGKLMSERETDSDGSVSYTEYDYDAEGRRIERYKQWFDYGSLSADETQTWKYNDAGRRIEYYRSHHTFRPFDDEKHLKQESIRIQKWDDAGRLIEYTNRVFLDGQLEHENSNTLSRDDKGKVVGHKIINKDPYETRVKTLAYTYNETGRVDHITTTTTHTDGSEPRTSESVITWVYEYDELGRVILETGHYENGSFAGKTEYEY